MAESTPEGSESRTSIRGAGERAADALGQARRNTPEEAADSTTAAPSNLLQPSATPTELSENILPATPTEPPANTPSATPTEPPANTPSAMPTEPPANTPSAMPTVLPANVLPPWNALGLAAELSRRLPVILLGVIGLFGALLLAAGVAILRGPRDI